MDLHVTLAGRGGLTAQIYRQLLDAVLDGRLRSGERLPPTRELAQRLNVSRNTVAVAFDRLAAEGFLVGQVGAGTFVTTEPLTRLRQRKAPRGDVLKPRRLWQSIPPPWSPRLSPLPFDFSAGVPDLRLFPLDTWRRLIMRELSRSAISTADYGEPAGHRGARAAIARYIGLSRSVRAGADDVIVTQGAQQALDLVGRVLIEPGSCVAVEEPGYPPARHLFASLGAGVVGVAVDADGLDVSRIPSAARVAYVTPSHQFPLGTPMSLSRRAALLAWADRRGAVVIEDDYDSDFRFSDRPLEPLQSIDRGGRVVYVGTFSKAMLPMLRLGFLIAPASLQPALRTAKQLTDGQGDVASQAALGRFIDEGLLGRHVRKMSREYAARYEQIVAALRTSFAAWLEPVPAAAGLHVCARLAPDAAVDVDDVVQRAEELGVAVRSLAWYCGESPAQAGLVIGFGAIPRERIEPGLRELARAFQQSAPLVR